MSTENAIEPGKSSQVIPITIPAGGGGGGGGGRLGDFLPLSLIPT